MIEEGMVFLRAIYLECSSGISGNMLLGAFVAAGMPVSYLEQELAKLGLTDAYHLHVEDVQKQSIAATYLDVHLTDGHDHVHHGEHEHHHEGHAHCDHHHHHEGHDHHSHDEYDHHHHHAQHHGHSHGRTMKDIEELLTKSSLSSAVKSLALSIFDKLAVAEGKVHGMPKDEVHFHEAGAVDSIVDIVGTAIAIDYFEIEKVFVGKVNTGSGTTMTQHGLMMIPAPATAELLQGLPQYHAYEEKELTTPTGAAVLATLADYREHIPDDFISETIAYGAGGWDLSIPNVLRLYMGEYKGKEEVKLYKLETNIDDMTGEVAAYALERLMELGAKDAWATPIVMKKGRPAYMLSVLVGREEKDVALKLLFRETTTIGVRVFALDERVEAERHMARVETDYGDVHLKVSAYGGEIVSIAPEYEDCKRLAKEQNVPIKKVQQAAVEHMQKRMGD